MDKIKTVSIEEEVFSLEDIEFGVKQLTKEKTKDIKGCQT
jgi:hypothetical protein